MPRHDLKLNTPCTIDLTSRDLELVKPFYARMFGWEITDTGEELGHYHAITKDGAFVGGATQHNVDFMGPDPINAWSLYFASDDTVAALERAEELGGETIAPAIDIVDRGTMGVASDPTGSDFGFWQPNGLNGFERHGEHGFPAWFELYSRDYDRAVEFYSLLLSAELQILDLEDDQRYASLLIEGKPTAAIWDIENVLSTEIPSKWHIFFAVDDEGQALSSVSHMGGTIITDPEPIQFGRVALVADPAGATFCVLSDFTGL